MGSLIALALLGLTIFKNDGEILKYCSLALNSLIFITEIVMLLNKLRWNYIVWYHNIIICILIVVGILLSVLFTDIHQNFSSNDLCVFTKAAVIVGEILFQWLILK